MMTHAAIIPLMLLACGPLAAASSWPAKSYVEVRAYAYNAGGDIAQPIVKKGRLDRSVVNKRGVVLTPEQANRLIAAVTGKRPEPEWVAACFNPRHAFVFYDTDRKPIAWVELCFECGNAEAEPYQKGQVYDVSALENLARELKLPLVPK
jgi:hypothetical protein